MARGQDELPYSFQFVAAPGDLSAYVNSFYVFRCDQREMTDWLPAYSGQLICLLKGRASIRLKSGREVRSSSAFLLGPLTHAHQFRIEGPALAVGTSLNFLGWAALTGLPCNTYRNDVFPVETGLPAPLVEQLRQFAPDYANGHAKEHDLIERFAPIVRKGLAQVPDKHVAFVRDILAWLSTSLKPELEDFYAAQAYSQRQIQRLSLRFFGQTPIHLVRRYRAIRAATLLSLPKLPEAVADEISDAFYDQAHMIKEIRYFTGRTPKRLQPEAGSVVTDMLGPDGYGAVDLFGGNEAEQLGRA